MDSPVRKMQKKNDYNRHKLFRKIRRRRRAQAEQLSHVAEKELKKKLRVTPVKYGEGKTSGGANFDEDVVDWIIREEGFSPSPVDIGDGKTTLGSGLTDKKWIDQYNKSGMWTPEQNKRAVREEVANRRRWAEKAIPNWDSLPASSQKALLSYKYNFDFTPKNSPKLFKALSDSDLNEAAKQMNATSKSSKFRRGLEARRQREQQWFLQDVQKRPAIQDMGPSHYEQPVSTRVYNPSTIIETIPQVAPIMVPTNGNYVEIRRITPEEVAKQNFEKRVEKIQSMERLAKAMSIADNQRGLFDFLSSPFSSSRTAQRISGGYKDGKTTGYVREKNNNPVAFDDGKVNNNQGGTFMYYTDPVQPVYVNRNTGEVGQIGKPVGSIVLPDVTIYPPARTTNNRPEDLDQINWMKNWLSARKHILEKNADLSKAGRRYYLYKPIRNTGDVRDAGWDEVTGPYGTYAEQKYPWEIGYDSRKSFADELIDAQIQNASNTPKHNIGPEEGYDYTPETGSLGMYVDPSSWYNSGNYVVFAGRNPKPGVKVHEFTHASHPDQQESYIEDVIFDGNVPDVVPMHSHSSRDNARELYGALQQFRFENNLDPHQKITKKWIDQNRHLFQYNYLENVPDSIKLRLFNEVAKTDTITNPIYYAYNNPFAQLYSDHNYSSGKTSSGIHIKPSHRGRLTALKKRTGKSEAELYRTGSAATRKMITFARNARKWNK